MKHFDTPIASPTLTLSVKQSAKLVDMRWTKNGHHDAVATGNFARSEFSQVGSRHPGRSLN
jgi:hypothetical protein